jgi:hypothetical protein
MTERRDDRKGMRGMRSSPFALRSFHLSSVAPFVSLGLLLHGGCGAPRYGAPGAPPPRAGTLITANTIAQSGARTAWDALRLNVRTVQFQETRGQPARITRRGRASIYLDDQVRVILDDIRIADIKLLEQMPASDILYIQVFTGLEATTYFGATSTSGVIFIRTTAGRS